MSEISADLSFQMNSQDDSFHRQLQLENRADLLREEHHSGEFVS
jgi:hypothetical protein